jgi:hypothetical protein
MKAFFLLFLIYSSYSIAEEVYELQGNIDGGKTTSAIKFTLNWKEENGIAKGTYRDNYYSTKATILRGIAGQNGRIFIATLPDIINGVKTISFLSSDLKTQSGTKKIPVSVVLRDEKGNPVTTTTVNGDLSGFNTRLAQRQEAHGCNEGFGVLAGYCGEYQGIMREDLDTNKRCDLTSYPNLKLVIDQNAEVGFVLGEPNALVNPPVHVIGRLTANTSSSNVDILGRQCRPLMGTTFPGDNCKRLNLTGSFSVAENTRHFSGKYTIIDEKLNQICTYGLSLDLTE